MRCPSWFPIREADWDKASIAELDSWRSEAQRLEESLLPEMTRRRAQWDEGHRLIRLACAGYDSGALEAIEKRLHERKPTFKVPRWVELHEQQVEARRRRLAASLRAHREDQRAANAIHYLAEHGRVVGRDYVLSRAVSVADQLAFELEIERLREGQGFIPFETDACGMCDGWDGRSARCHCGMSLVEWGQAPDHSFERPHVLPRRRVLSADR